MNWKGKKKGGGKGSFPLFIYLFIIITVIIISAYLQWRWCWSLFIVSSVAAADLRGFKSVFHWAQRKHSKAAMGRPSCRFQLPARAVPSAVKHRPHSRSKMDGNVSHFSVSVVSWVISGSFLGHFWVIFESFLSHSLVHLEIILKSFFYFDLVSNFGHSWVIFESFFGSFLCHFGVNFKLFLGQLFIHFLVIFWSFWSLFFTLI